METKRKKRDITGLTLRLPGDGGFTDRRKNPGVEDFTPEGSKGPSGKYICGIRRPKTEAWKADGNPGLPV